VSETEAIVLVWLIVSAAVVFILRGPLGKALARRLEGKQVASAETTELLDELHQQAGENEVLAGRVAELEERVDFAERLLARGQEAASRLPDGDEVNH
jgi:uncharacterized protein YlxW (UPF0749 family)